jgi:serine/threonine protein kinase
VNDAHFVAMEYVDGEDLSRLLQRIARLSHDKTVDITRDIAAGVSDAHACRRSRTTSAAVPPPIGGRFPPLL